MHVYHPKNYQSSLVSKPGMYVYHTTNYQGIHSLLMLHIRLICVFGKVYQGSLLLTLATCDNILMDREEHLRREQDRLRIIHMARETL